jgi:hypothetical protein
MPKYFTIIHSITALVNINTVGNACTVIRMAIIQTLKMTIVRGLRIISSNAQTGTTW